jgi:hypothetical protein
MKFGLGHELDANDLTSVVDVQVPWTLPVFRTNHLFMPEIPTTVPDELVLKGLSGAANSRFALINDRTFRVGEFEKVRVGKTNVMVRCLEIGSDSVKIQIAGDDEVKTLRLRMLK